MTWHLISDNVEATFCWMILYPLKVSFMGTNRMSKKDRDFKTTSANCI